MQPIEIVRGTTNIFNIEVFDSSGNPYEPSDGESLVFGIKKNPEDPEPVFQRVASGGTNGIFTVKIKPSDTEKVSHGSYIYDVGLKSGDDFYNIIEPNMFIIRANVTTRG